jgi:putative acyl-CoA dehydrogenase
MSDFNGAQAVFNQAPPLPDINLFTADRCLSRASIREGAGASSSELEEFGERLGRVETRRLAESANANEPILHTHDRYGHRVDEMEFHPAWHAMLDLAVQYGTHAFFVDAPHEIRQVARAAAFLMLGEIENGVQCPISMTHAALGIMETQTNRASEFDVWLTKMTSRRYDPRTLPIDAKDGGLVGMGMTERQGGSDLRGTTTLAERAETDGANAYRLVGHKWFFSAPTVDAHLVIARTGKGLSCFLMPRILSDGSRNPIFLQRLKDKLGNRSNASSEVEFQGALGFLVGEEGRGIKTIMEMVMNTRVDCVLGTAGMMRRALLEAVHHARHRAAFGRPLIEQPLMRNVLADLVMDSEVATLSGISLAGHSESGANERRLLLRRVLAPALKYTICKRGISFAGEAMEVLGGNGYIEESGLPRIFREMPLNSIWEGSGNVVCLDVLRALRNSRDCVDALLEELNAVRGLDACLDRTSAWLATELVDPASIEESQARHLSESIALAYCASLALRQSTPAIGHEFCANRLGERRTAQFGCLRRETDIKNILASVDP